MIDPSELTERARRVREILEAQLAQLQTVPLDITQYRNTTEPVRVDAVAVAIEHRHLATEACEIASRSSRHARFADVRPVIPGHKYTLGFVPDKDGCPQCLHQWRAHFYACWWPNELYGVRGWKRNDLRELRLHLRSRKPVHPAAATGVITVRTWRLPWHLAPGRHHTVVDTDDLRAEWAMPIPRDIGGHPDFGLKPLTTTRCPNYASDTPTSDRCVRAGLLLAIIILDQSIKRAEITARRISDGDPRSRCCSTIG